jgi:hypothetical protein
VSRPSFLHPFFLLRIIPSLFYRATFHSHSTPSKTRDILRCSYISLFGSIAKRSKRNGAILFELRCQTVNYDQTGCEAQAR